MKKIHAPLTRSNAPQPDWLYSFIFPAASFSLAIFGQLVFLLPAINPIIGLFFFSLAVILFLLYLSKINNSSLAKSSAIPYSGRFRPIFAKPLIRILFAASSIYTAGIAFQQFAGNDLEGGLWPWAFSALFFILAFAEFPDSVKGQGKDRLISWSQRINRKSTALLLGIVLLAVFFRFFRLETIPAEMTSDHAEKLLDVQDILDGLRPIFFGRNTGREGFQFYLTALLIQLTPLKVNHLALKVGTAIFGVMTIPFTYFLGKELYGRTVGLVAAFFLAISHWHVAITRVGLRFPFTAAFAAPALFFFFRALRMNRRNDWIAAGFFLGIGLHTYTPMRIVPVLFLLLILLKLCLDSFDKFRGLKPKPSTSWDISFWVNAILGGIFTGLLFLPLLRFWIDHPESFWFRSMSRVQSEALPFSTDILRDLSINIKNAFLMFNYRGDVVPINTIPNTPVLGIVSGALFILGCSYLIWSLIRWGDRRSLFLIITLFSFLLPSILSLSFPQENPSVARTGGAIPVVMIIVALPLSLFMKQGFSQPKSRIQVIVTGIVIILSLVALIDNYIYYFQRYSEHTRRSLWNATEMGQVLSDFTAAGGRLENAFHVPYPYWVDTRNIGINAGDPHWANVFDDQSILTEHRFGQRPRIYLLFPEDQNNRRLLSFLFPEGREEIFDSLWEGKDFIIFDVP